MSEGIFKAKASHCSAAYSSGGRHQKLDTDFRSFGMAIASSSRASVSSDEERSPKKKHKSRKESDRSRSHRGSSKESRKGKARSDDEGSIIRGEHGRRSRDSWEKRKIVGAAESAFKYLYPTITIPIPPALIHDPHRAADELMDTLLMR